jgi:MurNAc alpha-1-phosphate uridylyltransferase
MKAMILAAGLGTRMRPLTDALPKPLLRAGGRALIEHHLFNLAAAGVTDVVINHHHLGARLEAALGSGERYGVAIVYSPEPERLETAGGIVKALPLLGQEPFIVISADVWSVYDLRQLRPVDGVQTLAHLVIVDNPPHHPHGDFLLRENGRLGLREADDTVSGCTYSGISVMHPALFAGLSVAPLPLRPLLNAAITEGKVEAEHFSGDWFDIGTPARLQALDVLLADRRRNS